MAARKTRLNFTLSPDNVRAAQEIAEERGLKLSTFVDRAIAAYVRQLREPTPPAPSYPRTRTGGPLTGGADAQARRDVYRNNLLDFFNSHEGIALLEQVFGAYIEQRALPVGFRAGYFKPEEAAAMPPLLEKPTEVITSPLTRTSTPKEAGALRLPTVDIPPEVVERIRKFKRAAVAEATGQHPGAITKILSGERTRLRQDGYERLIAGLDRLEAAKLTIAPTRGLDIHERPPAELAMLPRRHRYPSQARKQLYRRCNLRGLTLSCAKVEARGIRRSPTIRQISQVPPTKPNEK